MSQDGDWRSSLREDERLRVMELDIGIDDTQSDLSRMRKERRSISLRVMQRNHRDKQKGVDNPSGKA